MTKILGRSPEEIVVTIGCGRSDRCCFEFVNTGKCSRRFCSFRHPQQRQEEENVSERLAKLRQDLARLEKEAETKVEKPAT